MKTVLVTGATGLVGQALVKQCIDQGWCVHYLTTSKSKIENKPNYKGFYWNPRKAQLDIEAFRDVEVIINLAGASIAKRWTNTYKKDILDSRVDSIKVLYNAIKTHNLDINHFISASAVGYYPDSLTNYYEETFVSSKNNFLVNVVRQWEESADSMSELNIPLAKIRIGVVLSNNGGVLPQVRKSINSYTGTSFSNGKQWYSWIHIDDLVNMFMFILNQKLEGVYNGVSPNPTTNATFTQVIADALNKPLWLPNIPKTVLKLMLGEMSQLLVEGQRVSSQKIQDQGFQFKYFQLAQAIEDLLN